MSDSFSFTAKISFTSLYLSQGRAFWSLFWASSSTVCGSPNLSRSRLYVTGPRPGTLCRATQYTIRSRSFISICLCLECVPQSISQQVKGKERGGQRHAGEYHQPPVRFDRSDMYHPVAGQTAPP